jgi:hypothetical protein
LFNQPPHCFFLDDLDISAFGYHDLATWFLVGQQGCHAGKGGWWGSLLQTRMWWLSWHKQAAAAAQCKQGNLARCWVETQLGGDAAPAAKG